MGQIQQQMGIDARMIYDLLDKLEEGELLTYDAMSNCIKRNIRNHWSIIETARRNHYANSKVFATVKNEGLKRVDDSTKVDIAEAHIKRVRGVIKKSKRICTSVLDFDKMPNDKKIKHNMILSLGATLLQFSSSNALKKIETKSDTRTLAVGEVMELFK